MPEPSTTTGLLEIVLRHKEAIGLLVTLGTVLVFLERIRAVVIKTHNAVFDKKTGINRVEMLMRIVYDKNGNKNVMIKDECSNKQDHMCNKIDQLRGVVETSNVLAAENVKNYQKLDHTVTELVVNVKHLMEHQGIDYKEDGR